MNMRPGLLTLSRNELGKHTIVTSTVLLEHSRGGTSGSRADCVGAGYLVLFLFFFTGATVLPWLH